MKFLSSFLILKFILVSVAFSQERPAGAVDKSESEIKIYGVGFCEKKYNDTPCDGETLLIDELNKISLRGEEGADRLVIKDVELGYLVSLLNDKLPNKCGWVFAVEDDIRKYRVHGYISSNLVNSIVSLMGSGGIYCRAADGKLEFRKSNMFTPNNSDNIKPHKGIISVESKVELSPESLKHTKELLNGEAFVYGADFGPQRIKPGEYAYGGNPNLIDELNKIVLSSTDKEPMKDISLKEAANLIYSRMPDTNKWKIIVDVNIEHLKVSSDANKSALMTLVNLMHSNPNFYCRLTNGSIEIKKGRNALNITPLK